MYHVFLGLGSNLGDRLKYLNSAVLEIQTFAEIERVSSVYECEPVEMDSTNLFFNIALGIRTLHQPQGLFLRLKEIEKQLGRNSAEHGKDRTIDIDILLYRGLSYYDDDLNVPHPRIELRRFVLEPLNEIAPTEIHPIVDKTIAVLLQSCKDRCVVVHTTHTLNFSHAR